MQDKSLHIIAFDKPEPPVYGGVIDVFYRIKALHKLGVKIILHLWEYKQKRSLNMLRAWCETIYFYPRQMGVISHLSLKPFIVKSRMSDLLVENLLKDESPILFEGIHSCGQLNDARLIKRKKIVRIHNIEHHYYSYLFHNEHNIIKKSFFLIESIKLKLFEKQLINANYLLAIAKNDFEYLKEKFPQKEIMLFPGFHPNETVSSISGKGAYLLYHGNLEVSENVKAAHFLIDNVFSKVNIPVIIAGRNPSVSLYQAIKGKQNIKLISNPSHIEMENLVRDAQIHILYTFQGTGLKLKLLNTLFQGRHILVNNTMLRGTGLEEVCNVANEPEELLAKTKMLFQKDFSVIEIENRKRLLGENYSNLLNAKQLLRIL